MTALYCLAFCRLTMGVTERGTVTGLRKEGSGSLDPASLEDMMQVQPTTAVFTVILQTLKLSATPSEPLCS
jgi:hypothetical protein